MPSNIPNDFIENYQDKKPIVIKNVLILVACRGEKLMKL